jgi:hypothetical protein
MVIKLLPARYMDNVYSLQPLDVSQLEMIGRTINSPSLFHLFCACRKLEFDEQFLNSDIEIIIID